DPTALASPHDVPIGPPDALAGRGARDHHGRVVLLRAVDAVRGAVVGRHAVDLRRRLVLDRRPADTAVDADVGAAVVGFDHPERVDGVDPEIVIVAVGDRDARVRLSAVLRAVETGVHDVDAVGGLRIDVYLR